MKWLYLLLAFSLITGFLIDADYSKGIETITMHLSPEDDDLLSDPTDPTGDLNDPPGDPIDPPPAKTASSSSSAPATTAPASALPATATPAASVATAALTPATVCFNPGSLPKTRAGCPAKPASVPPTDQGCYGPVCPTAVPCPSQNACPATSTSPGCQIQTLNYSYPVLTEIKLDIQNPPNFCWGAPCSNNESVVAVINTIDPRNLTPLATHRHILRALIPGTTTVIQNQWDSTKNCIPFSQVYNLTVTPKLKKSRAVDTQTSPMQTNSTQTSSTQPSPAQTSPMQTSSTQMNPAQTSSTQISPAQPGPTQTKTKKS